MKRSRSLVLFFILIMAALALYALWNRYGRGPGPDPGAGRASDGPVVLALIAPTRGPLEKWGQALEYGARMALPEDAGRTSGGRAVRLVVVDESNPAALRSVVQQAGPKGIVAFVGHLTERALLETAPSYVKASRPVLLPVLSSSRIALLGQGWFYRLMASDESQAAALAEYAIKTLGVRKAMVVFEDSPYGRRVAEAFSRVFGPERPVDQTPYPDKPEDLLALAEKASQSRPEAVLLALHGRPAVFVAQALRQAEVKTTLLGTHILALSDLAPILTQLSQRAFVSLPFYSEGGGPKGRALVEAFESRFQRHPNWLTALAYDATNLALEALDKGGPSPAEMKKYLDGLSSTGKLYTGAAGDYRFSDGGQGNGPVRIVQTAPALSSRLP